MPAYGRAASKYSNLVKQIPTLPIAVQNFVVSLNWSVRFQGFPQGSISYEGIRERDVARFEDAYAKGLVENNPAKVDINDIKFVVDGFSYERTPFVYKEVQYVDTYKISINLKSQVEIAVNRPIKIFKTISSTERTISISTLARLAGVEYTGKNFLIEIPAEADKDYAIKMTDVLEENAALLGCYISYSNGVELKPMTQANEWSFTRGQIITDGQNTIKPAISYNRAELTGDFAEPDKTELEPNGAKFTKKEPIIEVLVEETEDVTEPPANTLVLRSLSDNSIDGSGRKKTRKTTVLVDGVTHKETVEVFGFKFLSTDIHVGDGILYSDSPGAYWVLIEYQEMNYVREPLNDLCLNLRTKPPAGSTDLTSSVKLVVHPDYSQFVSVEIGNSFGDNKIIFKSGTKYLTKILTTGWRYARLEQETDQKNIITEELSPDDPETAPYWNLYQFKKLPKEAKTLYLLKSTNQLYAADGSGSQPFSVQWSKYEELEPRIKALVKSESVTKDGLVGILTPDPEYVEPLSIMKERQETSSFHFAPDPESSEDNPKQPRITGEETYLEVTRTITNKTAGKNRYKEKNINFSSQNAGFSDLAEEINFKDVLGRPPEAETEKRNWDKKEQTAKTNSTNPTTKKRYFITTDLVGNTAEGGSVSANGAKTLEEALSAIATNLWLQEMQTSQQQRTITWFYPDIRDGDRVITEVDRFRNYGKWRVIEASWNLKYDGISKLVPVLLTTEGTNVTLGLDRQRKIKFETVDATSSGNSLNSEPRLETTTLGGEKTLGGINISGPNRRRF
jgi:hypothetical protein